MKATKVQVSLDEVLELSAKDKLNLQLLIAIVEHFTGKKLETLDPNQVVSTLDVQNMQDVAHQGEAGAAVEQRAGFGVE